MNRLKPNGTNANWVVFSLKVIWVQFQKGCASSTIENPKELNLIVMGAPLYMKELG